jgi:hypothetical protein
VWHTLRFDVETFVDTFLDQPVDQRERPDRLRIPQFSRLRGLVHPYIEEGLAGPREMAEIELEDGTILLGVSMSYFEFLDEG